MSWTTEDARARARARAELARRAEQLQPGWKFSHGLFGWSATREGQTLSSSNMPGLLAQVAAASAAGLRNGSGCGLAAVHCDDLARH